MAANNPEEEVEKFDDIEDNAKSLFEIDKEVTDKEIFKLAKRILLICTILYLIIAIFRMLNETKGVIEVWEYSKVILNSIVSLVLGLYFGAAKKK